VHRQQRRKTWPVPRCKSQYTEWEVMDSLNHTTGNFVLAEAYWTLSTKKIARMRIGPSNTLMNGLNLLAYSS
jgi:hypothetical protein